MRIFKTSVLDREFEFVCDSRSTRNGFAHDVVLLVDGVEYARDSSFYINRTWESFPFQCAMLRVVANISNHRIGSITDMYRREHNVLRMTPKHKANAMAICNEDIIIRWCDSLNTRINSGAICNGY